MKLYIFDADGTLRRCKIPGQPCPNARDEWELMPNVADRLAEIDWNHARFAIISNQGGVGLGYLTYEMAAQLLRDLALTIVMSLYRAKGAFYMCPHMPDEGCECRKPKPKLLIEACKDFSIDPIDTMMIGDMESDRDAAEAAGIEFVWAKDFFNWEN